MSTSPTQPTATHSARRIPGRRLTIVTLPRAVSASMLAASGLSAGCIFGLEAEPSFDSGLPQDRFAAIQRASDDRDRSATDDLIRQLGSDDVLVRWAADDALRTITGKDAAFLPDGSEDERRLGIGRWIQLVEPRTIVDREPSP